MARANSWILPRSTCMVTGSPVLPIALLSTGIASSLAVVPDRARECSRSRRGREGQPLVEAYDFDPVRALARRILLLQRQRAAGRVDGVDRDGFRFLAGHDHGAALGIDGEAARLILGRRAREIRQLAGGRIHAERAERAAGPLGGVEELAVRREVQVGRPYVVVYIAPWRGTWGAGDKLGVGRQRRGRAHFGQQARLRVQ